MRSITRQVISTVLLAQLVLACGIITLLLLHERYTRVRALDARLQGRADSLAGAIQDAEDAAANVFVDPREFREPSGDRYAVYGEDGRRIGISSGEIGPLVVRKGVQGMRDQVGPDGVLYRVKEQSGLRIIDRAETHGVGLRRPITIVYATPETWVQHELREAIRFYIIAGILTTAIVTTLVTWVLRRSLKPISDLVAAAAAIEAPPSLRFSPPTSVLQVSELSILARSLEDVVGRVQHAFVKEQQFVSDAAHELKTAVAVVRSGLQVMLVRTRDAEDYISGLNRVLMDMERLEGVVRQMLQSADIAESATGGKSSDLVQMASQAKSNVAAISEQRNVAVRISGSPKQIAPIPPERATLLLENLIVNAVQHSPEGSTVTISITKVDDRLCLQVTDEGSGIRPEALPHVFERFYREDASRSRHTGGSGLGLAICKSIVEKAGGQISVMSELDRGTMVQVTFASC